MPAFCCLGSSLGWSGWVPRGPPAAFLGVWVRRLWNLGRRAVGYTGAAGTVCAPAAFPAPQPYTGAYQFDLPVKDDNADNLQKESSFFYPPPDGGWGWVVVLAACTHALLVSGFHNAFGVYMISLLETFQSSRSRTVYFSFSAWIGSVSYGFIMIFGPVSGKLLQKYGAIKVAIFGALVVMLGVVCSSYAGDIRVLFLTHGILVGVGSSFASTPGNFILFIYHLYFTTKRSFATGIVMAGGAAGTLVQNQVHRYLIKAFGWRTSLRVYCGILTICIFAGFAYRPLEKRMSFFLKFCFIIDLSLWKDSIFELWVCALGLAKFGFFIPFVKHGLHLAPFNTGVSSITSISKYHTKSTLTILFLFCFPGLLYLTIPLCTTFPALIAFGSLLGFFDAGNYVLLPVLTLDLMGAEKMPVAWGFMMAVHTISCFGPPFAGELSNTENLYLNVFLNNNALHMLVFKFFSIVKMPERQNEFFMTEQNVSSAIIKMF
uniref:Solute carrier family 16 member 5 n=1 Tax=Gopherus agassizii TaxID=38772 RepID=A0A452GL28_9SAUR